MSDEELKALFRASRGTDLGRLPGMQTGFYWVSTSPHSHNGQDHAWSLLFQDNSSGTVDDNAYPSDVLSVRCVR